MADRVCPHGLTTSHWFVGSDNYFEVDDRPDGVVRKYCAGPPRDWYFEAGWRRQLEFQMADSPLLNKILDGAQEGIDDALGMSKPVETPTYGLWQIHDVPSFHRVQSSVDSLKDFVPLGWSAPWGKRWYSDPRQPLQYRDWGAEVSPDGEHWTSVLTVGTPIYDEVCEDLGFQPR